MQALPPTAVPLPASPVLRYDLPPSPPASPLSPLVDLPKSQLSAAEATAAPVEPALPPPTFRMIPPTPLGPGEAEVRFATPPSTSDSVLEGPEGEESADGEGAAPATPPDSKAESSPPSGSGSLALDGDSPSPGKDDGSARSAADVPHSEDTPPAVSDAGQISAETPVASSDHPAAASVAAAPTQNAAPPRTIGRKISMLAFGSMKRSTSPAAPAARLPTDAPAARGAFGAAPVPPAAATTTRTNSTPPATLTAGPSKKAAAPPKVERPAVEAKKANSSGSGGGGLAGIFRSLTSRKKPTSTPPPSNTGAPDGGKGAGMLAKRMSVLRSPEQIRQEKEAMEVEAARTAERRHREATSLLGQPLRRSPSSGQAEPLGANAVAVGRSAPSPTMGQRPSSELGRSPSRSSGGPNFRPPSPSPVVAPLGAAVDGSPPSARSAASQVAGSPSRQGLAMVAENGAGPGQQRARPPPLQIPTYGRQRSTSSGAGSLPSALSAGGRTPLSADDSDDGGDGDGLVIGRRQRRRPQDSASTPPGLSYSPSSSTASHEPSADYLSKLELGPGGGRQASQYRPVPSQHQQRADSPSTPVDGQDFGSSPIDEFGGGSVRSQSRMSRTFGSLNSHGVNMRPKHAPPPPHPSLSGSSRKRSSSSGPTRTRTSASPQVLSRAEIAAKVSEASEQDQHDVDTFFSL